MSGILHWKSPGPVASAFFNCRTFVHGIQGPVGSGKTSTAFVKNATLASNQAPSSRDGRRKYKLTVVRDTYRQLWKTTIKSWWKWFPKTAGKWQGGQDEPATHEIHLQLPDQTVAEMIVDFVAIGEHAVEDVLRGYEPTVFYLNEADLLAEEVLQYCKTRAGRYPPMDEGGPTYWGVMMDFNAPVIDSWLHQLVTDYDPENFGYFCQPGGLDPNAENRANLVPGYYENMMVDMPDWMIQRMIHNRFGQRRDGKPVYPEFNDRLHVAPAALEAVPGIPLTLGLDAGGTPAATFWQRLPNGQWRGLDELVTGNDEVTGAHRFAELLTQRLRERYPGFPAEAWADPSAAFGADTRNDEKNWIQIVAAKTRIRVRAAAPNNDTTPRREALRLPLTRMIDGHEPGLQISPRMKVFRRGMNGGFRFRKMQIVGVERYDEAKPEKNEYSHVVESGEYALLGGSDYGELMGRARAAGAGRMSQALDDDHPEGGFSSSYDPGGRWPVGFAGDPIVG